MLFKAAVLSTLLSVGAEAGTSQDENNLVQAIRSGASNSISQTGSQIVWRRTGRDGAIWAATRDAAVTQLWVLSDLHLATVRYPQVSSRPPNS